MINALRIEFYEHKQKWVLTPYTLERRDGREVWRFNFTLNTPNKLAETFEEALECARNTGGFFLLPPAKYIFEELVFPHTRFWEDGDEHYNID